MKKSKKCVTRKFISVGLSPMDDEMLIEYVRRHVELYDISDKRYINWVHKQRVWKEIAKYLGHSAITCKMRWNNIRDNYRKSLKKRVTRSGLTGQPRKRRYKYENLLTFLLPFIRERDPSHAGSIRECDEVPTVDESDETPPMKRDDNRDSQTRPAASSEVTEDKTSKSDGEEPTVKNEPELIIPESPSSCFAESNDHNLQVASSHSVDTFLASLAPTLKSLSPYYLNITKTKIFSIVQKVEMIQILKGQKQQQQARKRRANSAPNQSDTSSLSISSMSPPSPDLSPLFDQRISETN